MLMRTVSMLALSLAVLLAGGCVKMKQIITVMPDGSGKLEFTLGVSQMLAQQAGENPLDQFTLENMLEEGLPGGVVAITEPQRWEDGGFEYISYTMYFEDINELEGPDTEMSEMFGDYHFEQAGDGCTLTVNGGLALSMISDYDQEQPDPQELAMMREMLKGFEVVEQYILPGEADPVDGVTMIDNTAGITIQEDNVINGDGPFDEVDADGPMELVVGENTIDQGAVDAFAQELADAIAAWEALQEQMEMDDQ